MTTPNSFLTVTVGGSGSFTVNSACQNINAAFFVGGGSPGAPTISSGVGLSGNGYLTFNTIISGNNYTMYYIGSDNLVIGTQGTLNFPDRSSLTGIGLNNYGTVNLGNSTGGSAAPNVALTASTYSPTVFIQSGAILKLDSTGNFTNYLNGNLEVNNGGTLFMGGIDNGYISSYNDLSMSGNLTFDPGSTLSIKVDLDLLNCSSISSEAMSVSDGATLDITGVGPTQPPGWPYSLPILHGNPIAGTFGTINVLAGPAESWSQWTNGLEIVLQATQG